MRKGFRRAAATAGATALLTIGSIAITAVPAYAIPSHCVGEYTGRLLVGGLLRDGRRGRFLQGHGQVLAVQRRFADHRIWAVAGTRRRHLVPRHLPQQPRTSKR